MPIKIGHAVYDERCKASGGVAGDSTKKEVCISAWYDGKWDVVLRPKSAVLAEKSAKACEAACVNDKIGYDQGQRNSLYLYAKVAKFDLAKIEDECETDCSALMHVCAIAGGAKLSYGANGLVTWDMVDAFAATGQYEKLTDSKYLASDAYLKRGDVLVRQSGHTAMALENGAKAGGSTAAATVPISTMNVSLPVLKYGMESDSVKALQILLGGLGYYKGKIDGEFGDKTLAAVEAYQKAKKLTVDGEVGAKTWGALLT